LLELVSELKSLRTIMGEPLDLALTTNGHSSRPGCTSQAAGLDRVTVSMDAVDAQPLSAYSHPGSFEPCCAAFVRRVLQAYSAQNQLRPPAGFK